MKKIMSILFALFAFISCDQYQEDPLNLNKSLTRGALAAPNDIILDEPTNDLTLSENFQIFLDKYLISVEGESADTLFDYDKYRNERSYRSALELRQNLYTIIAKTDLEALNQGEKVAFLINAYNFFAIEMVSNNYFDPQGKRTKSISDIGGTGSFSAFKQPVYNIGGEAFSLDRIEKETLVPLVTFANGGVDARVHFAVICAANGCPILMKDAYTAKDVQQQLTNATVEGLKLKRNLDQDAGTLTSLFNWYQTDFKNHSERGINKTNNLNEFISMYTTGVDTSKFSATRNNAYDWAINKVVNESDKAGFYSDMQFFLDEYVKYIGNSKDTLVDYERLYNEQENVAIKALRNRLYTAIAEIDLSSLSQDEKVAFLTNTYNFLAIEIVIKNYKVNGSSLESISDIGGAGSFAAFRSKEFNIGGVSMSLDDVEKGTLVPTLTFPNGSVDARVHFAVICAAKGCPILKKQVYLPSIIDSQYTSATVDSLKEKRNFNLDNGQVNLTNLFSWYGSDFSNHSTDGTAVIKNPADFLEFYIDGLMLDSVGTPSYIDYDWKLNKL
jgi:hypothetical protein